MDDIDGKLIALLRHDGRATVSSLGTALGLGRAAVAARLARLQRDGPIRGFTVVLDGEDEAHPIRGMMTVEIQGRGTEEVVSALDRMPEVRAIHTTNGRWDIVCELGTYSLTELDAVLRRVRLVRGVANSETNLYLTTRRAR